MRTVFQFSLGCLILVLLVAWAGPQEVLGRLAELSAPIAAVCIVTALLVQVVGAVRVGGLAKAQGLPVKMTEAFSINVSAVFYGLFLPGGNATGLLIRLLRMSGKAAFVGVALLVLASDRLTATCVGAVIGVIADVWLRNPGGAAITVLLVAAVAASCVAAIGLFSPRTMRLWAVVRSLPVVGRLTRIMRYQFKPVGRFTPQTLLTAAGLSFATHALGIAIWLVLAISLGMDLDAVRIAWVRSAALVVGLVPVTVGGLGLREGAVVYLVTMFGVSAADAVSFSLLAFGVTSLSVGAVGGLLEVRRWIVQSPGKDR